MSEQEAVLRRQNALLLGTIARLRLALRPWKGAHEELAEDGVCMCPECTETLSALREADEVLASGGIRG